VFKKNFMMIGFLILISGLISSSFAADSQVLAPKAVIPPASALSVSVSKVVGTAWSPATSLDFANLVFDAQNNIFISSSYYAVDVGITSNAATWQVKHETTSIVNGAEKLDENINVTFMKQLSDKDAIELLKVNFAESNGTVFSKSQLTGGWLRIYYGIATGEVGKDAPNAKPVGPLKTMGNYQGTVKITLTEN